MTEAEENERNKLILIALASVFGVQYFSEAFAAADKLKQEVDAGFYVWHNEMSAAEALYGFCAWLTTRNEKTIMSSSDDCAPIVMLIQQFCKENKLPEPRDGREKNLIHPSGECSGPVAENKK